MSQLTFRLAKVLLSQGQTDYFLNCRTVLRDCCELSIKINDINQIVSVDFLPIFIGDLCLSFEKLEVQEKVILKLLCGEYDSMEILPIGDKIRIKLHQEGENEYSFPLIKYSEFYEAIIDLSEQVKQRYTKLTEALASDSYYQHLTEAHQRIELHLSGKSN
jgi:hypothetical protein